MGKSFVGNYLLLNKSSKLHPSAPNKYKLEAECFGALGDRVDGGRLESLPNGTDTVCMDGLH